ncbi:unnamed protein product [Polarella glacialis]|uniref:Uncharacterized protein n=1 Tax=Polarella glacialis TaxID=89957 RepID=A0A813GW79_POLGL|nr:unnamed protein product [Polarella glacialis]
MAEQSAGSARRIGLQEALAAAGAAIVALGGVLWYRRRAEQQHQQQQQRLQDERAEAESSSAVAKEAALPSSSLPVEPTPTATRSAASAALWRALEAPKSEWDPDTFVAALQTDPNAHRVCDDTGRAPLTFAIQRNKPFAARSLLAARADASTVGPRGWTSLHYCALDGRDIELLGLLAAARADPNAVTNDGMPVLFYATNAGNEAAVNALIHAGARPDAVKQAARRHGGTLLGD